MGDRRGVPAKASVLAAAEEADRMPKSDEPILCKVCLSVYDEVQRLPLRLDCKHTFCATCIADSLMMPEDLSRIFCPLCKSTTILGKRGMAGLPVNAQSVESVRLVERRQQMSQMEVERRYVEGRPSYDVALQGNDYPLRGANKNDASKLKGILKHDQKKQVRFSKTDMRMREEGGGVGGARVGGGGGELRGLVGGGIREGAGKEARSGIGNPPSGAVRAGNGCHQCVAEKVVATRKEVSAQHAVVVKATNRLHPPPNSEPPLTGPPQSSTSSQPGGPQLDDDEVEQDIANVLSSVLPLQDAAATDTSGEQASVYKSVLSDCNRKQDPIPEFLKPLGTGSSTDPDSIVPDNTLDPFRQSDQILTDSAGGSGARRIYPVSALLYMATAEGIPRDLIGSAANIDPETNALASPPTTLTDSQRQLRSTAKYVGRFGKYSENRPPPPGSFIRPTKVASSPEGDRLAIADPGSASVHLFSARGEYSWSFVVTPDEITDVCFIDSSDLAVSTEKGVQVYSGRGVATGGLKKSVPIGQVVAVASFKQGFVAALRRRVSVCKTLTGSVIHSVNGTRDRGLLKRLVPFEDVTDIGVTSKSQLCILESHSVKVTDDEGVIVFVVQPGQEACGPIGQGVALAICPEDQGIVVIDGGHRRVLLFAGDGGQFTRCLVNLEETSSQRKERGTGEDGAPGAYGVAVNKSGRMYLVLAGKQLAEVRVYTL